MTSQRIYVKANDVNGNISDVNVTSSGRTDYGQQVVTDRHYVTVQRGEHEQGDIRVQVRDSMRVGTWNINTLYQLGKYENIKQEMLRMKVDIMGLSEVRWEGSGIIADKDVTFIYSGGEAHHKGVGIMLTAKAAASLTGYWAISERLILVKLSGKQINLNIIQVYAPTCDYSEEEIDDFYESLTEAKKMCKEHDLTLVIGDLNAKIGRGSYGDVVGSFGLGNRNERGDKWIEWCSVEKQIIVNSFFQQHSRRLWTWKSPGGRTKNQIDYITINKRFRNAITKCKTYPGADGGLGCDHVPVIAELKLRLKSIKKKKPQPRKDLQVLHDSLIQERYAVQVQNRFQMLHVEEEGNEDADSVIEREWKIIQDVLVENAKEICPNVQRRGRQKWMTEEILVLMDERRKMKGNQEIYNRLDQDIKVKCKERKEEWIQQICEEVEQLEKTNTRQMYERVREISGKRRMTRSSTVKDKDGNVLMDSKDVLARWMEYVGELYDDERGIKPEYEGELEGPVILREEIVHAIKSMKSRKATGSDEIAIEMIRAAGNIAIEKITELTNRIYNTGYIPERMRESTFITIPKKPGATECSKHRTISIMSQLSKIILRVLLNRIRNKINAQIPEEQCGFRKGKGTANALFTLRTIIERATEVQKDLYIGFIDFEKAFDTVRHAEMVKMLENIGLDKKDTRLIANLYWDQKANVEMGGENTEWIDIKRGVRQGCVISPDLFSLYGQKCMEDIEEMEGIKIGGKNITNIRYADDTALIADSEEKLQSLMEGLSIACNRRGMKINLDKTEVMGITKRKEQLMVQINIDGKGIKQVNKIQYLGSLVTEDGMCEQEIKKRIGIAKTAFGNMKKLATNTGIGIEIRIRLMKCFIWSTLLYGCETWTLKKNMIKKLEAFEMWCIRRMLRIHWTARVTNEEVLRRVGMERALMNEITKRQMKFVGHVIRARGMEYDCLMGKIEGKRARGRQRKKLMDCLLERMGGIRSVAEVARMTEDREGWRVMIANVTRPALQ